jgi:hypothetical protein
VIQSATPTIRCFSPASVSIEASFDGPQLTSDGGLVWLAEADAALGLCAALAGAIPDWRTGPVQHSLELLIRQRVFQLACGYEDQDDADSLRHDPLLKLACGRLPSDPPLASQPTLSRLENAVDARTCYRLSLALVRLYLQERGRAGKPDRIVLDFDGTDDPAHGQQEGIAYHGYFEQYMYHPLLVFDGETGQPIIALLRPGTAHAGHGALAILRRLVRLLRHAWPDVAIELRADSGFALPAIYTYCEEQRITYTIALGSNNRLETMAAPLLAQAREQRAETGEKVRLVAEGPYAASSWETERRVVYKAEALEKGPNTRFVVTTRRDAPDAVYDWYIQRGDRPESCIKDLKGGCAADRLSDHAFWANQFRLLLSVATYWLLDTIRRWLSRPHLPRMQLDTLRLQLLKIGGWVRQRLDRVPSGCQLHLASSHPGEPLWRLLAARPNRL